MVPAPFLRRALPKKSFISAIVPSVSLLGITKLFHEKDRILHLQDVSIMDTLIYDRHGNPVIYAGSPCVNWGGKPL
jgi:hypothetical protein